MPRVGGLTLKLVLAFLIVALAGIAIVAFLSGRSTTREFESYRSHVEAMQDMMGGGMMGDGTMASTTAGLAQDFQQQVDRSLWIAGGASAAIAVLLAVILAYQIVRPLRRLTRAAAGVGQGLGFERLKASGRDEVGDLTQAFNTMADGLERSERLRRQMVADIAHELRNPLTVIQGNLEAVLDGVAPMDKSALEAVHGEVLHLGRLVSDLRDLSTAEAKALTLSIQKVEVEPLLRSQIEVFRPKAGAQGVDISLDVPAGLPTVQADPGRLEQIVFNLLDNAMRYTPKGGGVKVSAESSDSWVIIAVQDSGAGISSEDLPHVFERFYRADPSRARASGGSGLGLAIAKSLVEAHGGRLWVESEMGSGSIFRFTMPTPTPRSAVSRG